MLKKAEDLQYLLLIIFNCFLKFYLILFYNYHITVINFLRQL